jgi:hypothetical protein
VGVLSQLRDADASGYPVERLPFGDMQRVVRLLVSVAGVSGTRYPVGTEVSVSGSGPVVEGFVAGDWLPLQWWEYGEAEPPAGLPRPY